MGSRPLELLDKWGFCPFCLAIKNYSTFVRARFPGRTTNAPQNILVSPVELTAWLDEQVEAGCTSFELNQVQQAFVPVAVWQNTPLCGWHLWQFTDPEYHRPKR